MRPSCHADHESIPTALDAALLRSWPMPLDEHGDKLTRGTVLVIAGATTTAGAALLSGTAALRMGAGRLQIATVAPIAVGVAIAMPEAMVLPLAVDEDDQLLADGVAESLAEPIANAQAILIGPGMTGLAAIRSMLELAATAMSPDAILVADAAALLGIASIERSAARSFAKHLVLTPNRDELQTLVESLDAHGDDGDPAAVASRELGAVVTCFGELTSFDERRWRAETATPGLGTSGSGDVLAGLVAGAAARCGDAAQAACWATYVHGAAGNRLSERLGTTSFIAANCSTKSPTSSPNSTEHRVSLTLAPEWSGGDHSGASVRQLPISPPSSLVMTSSAERGRPPAAPSGQELNCFGFAGSLAAPLGARPGAGCRRTSSVSSGVTKHAGDLALLRADQEAAGLAGGRVGAQHLVVAEAGVGAGVDRRLPRRRSGSTAARSGAT